ncbi:clotting factor C-like isoform X1 [Diabrotica virgifera virgifera]|uniref:Limulus clotting factor C-like isoform X1 n=1 Tax=Diabrotica virgifera virgifera TaxID=50390 RepID=A0A6P7FSN3_DIAVI|nr:clotting factor C-like isoform X1 [Diabrotica virgifera virgifera]
MEVKSVLLVFIFIGLTNSKFESSSNSIRSIVRQRRQSSFNCTLPTQLENGRVLVYGKDIKPGDQVDIDVLIKLECHKGYKLSPNTPFIICDGNWEEIHLVTCKKTCPPFYSTATTTVKCRDKDYNTVPCDKAIDGTYLTYECASYHEIPPGGRNILYCNNGLWDFPKPVCQPICGRKVYTEPSLIWNGNGVNHFDHPWVIAVFKNLGKNYENICGGTLVSIRTVITAAHCVTDTYGHALGRENFQVVAGKMYNAFGDERDTHAQYRKISEIVVHEGYRGESQRYIADIALLITQELFKLDRFVLPVCIDYTNSVYLTNHQIGEVAGWGITEEEKPSERLKSIRIPYKDAATCAKELPERFEQQYHFFDKICAGRQNGTIAVCKGDSGSGLIFKNRENDRYYLQGIVSISPNLYTSQCNYQTIVLYTSVLFYNSFIKREITKSHLDLEDCILPAYPKNGKWFVEGGVEKKPGDIVLSSTLLRFSCNMGFILSTTSPYYRCESSDNQPTCRKLCPKPSLPNGTQILCNNYEDQYIDCSKQADGDSITFTCPNRFVSDEEVHTRYCRYGSWNSEFSCKNGKQEPKHVL